MSDYDAGQLNNKLRDGTMLNKITKSLKTIILPSIAVAGVAFSQTALAETSMWKVSKGGNELYIGGTVHMLPESQFPLPAEFDKAYQAASTLVLEVVGLNEQDPVFQQKLVQSMMYSDGSNLKAKLTPETFAKLSELCTTYQIPLEQLLGFKPAMIQLTLLQLELMRHQMSGEGVDMFFAKKATSDNKQQVGLETIDEQIALITDMGVGEEEAFILKTIEDTPKIKELMDQMITAWRAGDMAKLNELAVEPTLQASPSLYQAMFVNRNNNWVPKIENMLNDKPVELVLVGAGHLAGKDSVIAQLKNKGYKVEKL